MGAELLTHTEGRTRVLTLRHSGQRNALHPDMYVAGLHALEQAERDADIRSVVLTGADGHFCAGGQLQRLQANGQRPKSLGAIEPIQPTTNTPPNATPGTTLHQRP